MAQKRLQFTMDISPYIYVSPLFKISVLELLSNIEKILQKEGIALSLSYLTVTNVNFVSF